MSWLGSWSNSLLHDYSYEDRPDVTLRNVTFVVKTRVDVVSITVYIWQFDGSNDTVSPTTTVVLVEGLYVIYAGRYPVVPVTDPVLGRPVTIFRLGDSSSWSRNLDPFPNRRWLNHIGKVKRLPPFAPGSFRFRTGVEWVDQPRRVPGADGWVRSKFSFGRVMSSGSYEGVIGGL